MSGDGDDVPRQDGNQHDYLKHGQHYQKGGHRCVTRVNSSSCLRASALTSSRVSPNPSSNQVVAVLRATVVAVSHKEMTLRSTRLRHELIVAPSFCGRLRNS
jgi:hypothetical protein